MAEREREREEPAGRVRPIGARALEAAIALGDGDAVDKILDSGAF